MIGYPGSGKSSFAAKTFGTNDRYVIIEGDVMKTVPKMLAAGRKALQQGKSVVFDATNTYIPYFWGYIFYVTCI